MWIVEYTTKTGQFFRLGFATDAALSNFINKASLVSKELSVKYVEIYKSDVRYGW